MADEEGREKDGLEEILRRLEEALGPREDAEGLSREEAAHELEHALTSLARLAEELTGPLGDVSSLLGAQAAGDDALEDRVGEPDWAVDLGLCVEGAFTVRANAAFDLLTALAQQTWSQAAQDAEASGLEADEGDEDDEVILTRLAAVRDVEALQLPSGEAETLDLTEAPVALRYIPIAVVDGALQFALQDLLSALYAAAGIAAEPPASGSTVSVPVKRFDEGEPFEASFVLAGAEPPVAVRLAFDLVD